MNFMCKLTPVKFGKFSSWCRHTLPSLGWIVAAALVALPAQSQEATGRRLESIDVQPLPGQRLELRLRLDGPAPEPRHFMINDPARIALDLPDTSLALPSRRREVNLGPLTTILAAEANGRTRIVLNMTVVVPYETRVEGDSIYVAIGAQGAGGSPWSNKSLGPSPTTLQRNRLAGVPQRQRPQQGGTAP